MYQKKCSGCFRLMIPSGFAAFLSIVGSNLYADADFGIQVNQALLESTNSKVETSENGSSNSVKAETIETQSNSLEVVFHVHRFHLYTYPTSAESPFAIGMNVTDALELGLELGLNSVKIDKPDSKTDRSEYGLFGVYTRPVGSLDVEINAFYGMLSVRSKYILESSSESVTSDLSGSAYNLGLSIVVPIAGALSYVGGVGYGAQEIEIKLNDVTTKTKKSDLSINVATVRLDF